MEQGILYVYSVHFLFTKGEFFMKFQWNLLLGLLFAIIIAVFAVFNVDAVQVNYVFGKAEWPLVLVILCSALLGAMVSGFVAMFRSVQSNRRIKELQKEMTLKEINDCSATKRNCRIAKVYGDNVRVTGDFR